MFYHFFFFRSVHPIQHQATKWYILPVPGAPSPPITWIPFDSVINSLVPLLFSQGYNALQHIICESDQLLFSLAKNNFSDAIIS